MPSPVSPQVVAYAQGKLRQGIESAIVAGKVATRFPGLAPWEVDFAVGRAQRLIQQSGSAASAPPGTTLGQQFPEASTETSSAQVDALVAFGLPGNPPLYRTLRFNVPWEITIEDYSSEVSALALVWITSGPTGPATLPGGSSFEVVDLFHRII